MKTMVCGVLLVLAATAGLYVLGETAPVAQSPVEIEVQRDARN
ncbi:MAG: hypothetical protein AAFR11_15870 [Pseudomonadota bacterium]